MRTGARCVLFGAARNARTTAGASSVVEHENWQFFFLAPGTGILTGSGL
jgi:hypothetical protein